MVARELGVYGGGITDTGQKIIADYLRHHPEPGQRVIRSGGAFKEASKLTDNYKAVTGNIGDLNIGNNIQAAPHDSKIEGKILSALEAKKSELDAKIHKASTNQNIFDNKQSIMDTKSALTKQIDKAEDSRLSSSLVGSENPNTKKRKDHQE